MASVLEDNLKAAQTPPDVALTAPALASHETSHPVETEGAGLGTVAAIGAAGVAAGVLVAGTHALAEHTEAPVTTAEAAHHVVTPALNDRIMEELESDLFASASASVAETPISEAPAHEPMPTAAAPAPDAAENDAAPIVAEAPLAAAEEALASLHTSQFGQDFALSPDFTLPLTLPPDPIPAPEPALAVEPESIALPAEVPAEPAVEAPPAPQPGLIADADLAALAEDVLPPLAPISTLEVVGAYDSAGTRFTMYSDGSVTAAGPEGETRFRTLDDLRRHLGTHQG